MFIYSLYSNKFIVSEKTIYKCIHFTIYKSYVNAPDVHRGFQFDNKKHLNF